MTKTIEVTVTREVRRTNMIPAVRDVVIVRGPGVHEFLGSWSTMCVPPGPDGVRRSGKATEVPDDVVLEALFGDQSIYDMGPAPEVDVEVIDNPAPRNGDRRYRITVSR